MGSICERLFSIFIWNTGRWEKIQKARDSEWRTSLGQFGCEFPARTLECHAQLQSRWKCKAPGSYRSLNYACSKPRSWYVCLLIIGSGQGGWLHGWWAKCARLLMLFSFISQVLLLIFFLARLWSINNVFPSQVFVLTRLVVGNLINV
jgi:hypothetical protein